MSDCHFHFSLRFIRPPFNLTDPLQRPHLPKGQPIYLFGAKQFNNAFSAYFDLNKGFFGELHIRAIISLVGRKSMAVMIGELAKNLELLFTQLLSPYVQALMRGFPPSTKLPLFLYKTIGTYEYFYAKLKPLLTYRDLKTEVFQSFREFGNTFCFVALLDQVLEQENVLNVVLSAPFLGLVSSTSDTPPEELFTLKNVMQQSKDFLAGSGTTVVLTHLFCVVVVTPMILSN